MQKLKEQQYTCTCRMLQRRRKHGRIVEKIQSCKHGSQKPQQTTPLQIRTRAWVTGLWCVHTAADARSVCCTASNVKGVFLCK